MTETCALLRVCRLWWEVCTYCGILHGLVWQHLARTVSSGLVRPVHCQALT